MAHIRHICISEGHNFFGRYGKSPLTHPAHEVDAVQCHAGRGLVGDRFHGHQRDYKGQITFFDWSVFLALRDEVGGADTPPSAMRRNVLIEGAGLAELIGKEFELQGVRFAGCEECRPCEWMDHAVGPGAHAFLKGRGGLRARILSDGVLSVGPAALEVMHAGAEV